MTTRPCTSEIPFDPIFKKLQHLLCFSLIRIWSEIDLTTTRFNLYARFKVSNPSITVKPLTAKTPSIKSIPGY